MNNKISQNNLSIWKFTKRKMRSRINVKKFLTRSLSSRYRIDARDKPVTKAQHSSDPSVFGQRALFRITFPSPAVLVIDDIKRHDAATYRCRVDFRKGQTRSFRYNLTVISEYHRPRKKFYHLSSWFSISRCSRCVFVATGHIYNIFL